MHSYSLSGFLFNSRACLRLQRKICILLCEIFLLQNSNQSFHMTFWPANIVECEPLEFRNDRRELFEKNSKQKLWICADTWDKFVAYFLWKETKTEERTTIWCVKFCWDKYLYIRILSIKKKKLFFNVPDVDNKKLLVKKWIKFQLWSKKANKLAYFELRK